MVDTPYTTEALITRLIGQLGLDLRADDSPDIDTATDYMEDAIDTGSADLDFFLSRYAAADIASNNWCQQHATWFAVRRWCLRRLNDVPKSVLDECKRREDQLMLVLQGKVPAPRLARSRRPVAVTNYHADQRRFNNQVRVDRNRSTGVAKDYRRVDDPSSPDER